MSYNKKLYRLWQQQSERCIWCGKWCWLTGIHTKQQIRDMMKLKKGSYQSAKKVRRLRATIEHVIPTSKGGTNKFENLVCACASCNLRRGNDMHTYEPKKEILSLLDQKTLKHLKEHLMPKVEIDRTSAVWSCKIGPIKGANDLPSGADLPMREAVEKAFRDLVGYEADVTFSGWGDKFSKVEIAIINDNDDDAITDGSNLVREFLDKYEISCAESIYQRDVVAENALELIEKLAEEAGYWVDSEEEE